MEDTILARRLENILTLKKIAARQIKMMGGLCFMVDDKMCFGIFKGDLMARVDPLEKEDLKKLPGVGPMVHGGRASKSFLKIDKTKIDDDERLQFWVEKCLEFNPKAKASRKQK